MDVLAAGYAALLVCHGDITEPGSARLFVFIIVFERVVVNCPVLPWCTRSLYPRSTLL
jgi:hypothetical protein